MANLPSDRTKLQVAVSNQQASVIASAQANREMAIEAYDTIDLLNQKVDSNIAAGALAPYPPSFMSRQAMINGNMDIAQRGTSFTNPTNSQCTIDHYQSIYDVSGGGTLPTTIIHSQQALTAGDIQGSYNYYRIVTNGAGSGFAASFLYWIRQKIENGTRFLCGAGKKVTVSFWARSSISGKRLGLHLLQSYGTGGTPTSAEIINGTNFSLTSTWTKYSYTFTTNTLVGKTFGTNNDDILTPTFMIGWGSTYQDRAGATTAESFGGSGNIDIAQVQVNAGDAALPFQPRSFAEELALCQRYGRTGGYGAAGTFITATNVVLSLTFGSEMRTSPVPTLLQTAIAVEEVNVANRTSSGSTLVGTTQTSTRGCRLEINGFTGGTAKNAAILKSDAVFFDAEL
jgi:hypothetical protein